MVLSLATDCSSTSMLGLAPSNTQAFWCFHNSQATRMIRVLRPLPLFFGTLLIVQHHQQEKLSLISWRARVSRSSLWKIKAQACLANTQEMRICWIFSSAWSQSGHAAGWGSLRLARRSMCLLMVFLPIWSGPCYLLISFGRWLVWKRPPYCRPLSLVTRSFQVVCSCMKQAYL